jgi:hypothetical protein
MSGDHLGRRKASVLAWTSQARAEYEIGFSPIDWSEDCRNFLGPIAAIAINEKHNRRVRRDRHDPRPHGSTIAPALFDDDASSRGRCSLYRSVGGAAVNHDCLADTVGEDGGYAGTDRSFLIQARDDRGNTRSIDRLPSLGNRHAS